MTKACDKIHPIKANTVEPLFRGHPRDQGKCPLNGDWAGVC